jgi:hypothetical protein
LTLKATSTGTPAVGFGTAINFIGQTATSNFENAGFIAVASTDITPGSEDFRMRFGLQEAGGTYSTKMDLDSAGNLQIDGDLTVSGANINTGVDNVILNIDRTVASGDPQNTFKRVLTLNAPTDGTPAIGYGTALGFQCQTTAGPSPNIESAGYIAVTATDLSAGLEDFEMSFGLVTNGAAFTEKMTLSNQGYLVASSATFGNIDIDTTSGQIDTNNGFDLTLDSDGGDVIVNDRLTVNVTLQTPSADTVTSGNISVGSSITKFTTTSSGQTSTLDAGNDGQFKTLVRTTANTGGNMVVTVTNAGWKGGSSGTITFGDQGDSCFLQYIAGYGWIVVGVGNPQPVFA